MKAIGYNHAGPITAPDALIEFETETPGLGPRDLLVEIRGIAVNPVDVKVRANMAPEKGTKVIGYDAAGVVRQIGRDVSKFNVGDEVFYAGDLTRPGTNSEFHAVDERIVGTKPKSLCFAEAAGFPLTSITAWEILFDSFALKERLPPCGSRPGFFRSSPPTGARRPASTAASPARRKSPARSPSRGCGP